MANQEQVRILEQGADIWNKWRESHITADIDLVEADLCKARLKGADLMGAHLTKARLREADLTEADLVGANLTEADLTGARLRNADFSDVHVWDDDLTEAMSMGIDFSVPNNWVVNLSRADLTGADLTGANLRQAFLMGARLKRANLAKANLHAARLEKTDFSEACLEEANLTTALLEEANLTEARLRKADLRGIHLTGTDLTRADLAEANLTGAHLREANFTESWIRSTMFGDTYLDSSFGLDTTRHGGPSTIGADTLRNSKGHIPVEFLRGCGLNDWEIEAARLHDPALSNDEVNRILYKMYDLRATQALQISPLFISYSHGDGKFVDKIGACLTEKGVRYWRDIHDMKAGRMEKQIDVAIRQNPTVLLVLSKNSLQSDWVEHEVRTARSLEKELGRDVLCPVALDDSWKSSPWPRRVMEQVMEYNILDYAGWEDNDEFERMFVKLVDGLNLYYKKDQ